MSRAAKQINVSVMYTLKLISFFLVSINFFKSLKNVGLVRNVSAGTYKAMKWDCPYLYQKPPQKTLDLCQKLSEERMALSSVSTSIFPSPPEFVKCTFKILSWCD